MVFTFIFIKQILLPLSFKCFISHDKILIRFYYPYNSFFPYLSPVLIKDLFSYKKNNEKNHLSQTKVDKHCS